MSTNIRTEIALGMSNFDHSIDEGLDAALRAGNVCCRHDAWNFNGCVWFSDGLFKEEVWQYHVPVGVRSAKTLRELMKVVNDEFGWE